MKYFISIILVLALGILGVFYFKSNRVLETKGGIEVQSDSTNALRVTVNFELLQATGVYVKYWVENQEDENALYSEVSPADLKHSIKLVGLLEERNYHYKIIEASKSFAKESLVGKFVTSSAPRAMLRMRWTEEPTQPITGYILSQRPRVRAPEGYVYLLDGNGEAVWYTKIPGLPKLSWWTEHNTILVLSGNPKNERSAGDHIFEYDIYGNELTNLDLNQVSDSIEAHHEIRYADETSLLTLIYDRRLVDLSAKGGKSDQEIKGDAIIKLTKGGKILWKWSVFDILDPSTSNYPYDSLGEWGHANTLAIDRDGNYLISFRDWSEIWKINSKDGSLLWKLGDRGDFKLPENFSFSGQHAIHINPLGEYMMYDNGVKNRRSRVLAFTLDESSKTVNVKLNILLPEWLYSEKRGSAYYLDKSRILICAAESSTVAIIDTEGNVLARAHTGLPDYYRAVYVPRLLKQ